MTADASDVWQTLLRDLSVKSALLLLSAWALTLAMRRVSASARHLVWLLVFAGLLALPLLSLTLPARPVPILPAAPVSAPAPAPADIPPAAPESLPVPFVSAPPPAVRPMPAAPPVRPPLFCLYWLLGVALFLAPVIFGLALAGRRIRRCRPVADPAVLALAAEAACRIGVRRPITLRSGPSVSVPVTFGLMRPAILLPDGAASWPAERLRVALLHELAHVKRGDWATQTAARLVCALFWHNPLVWPAARMLRAESERACDDLVLSAGVPAPDYAQHLLVVAAALSGAACPLPLAVPMAGRSPLESRLRAVLSSRPRRPLSRPRAAFAFIFILALFVLVPLAALRPAARAARRMVPALPSAPADIPLKAIRHFPAPVKVVVAVPPAPLPTQSTPIGVPPMKTLTPAKTVALAALAATLALPGAQAKPRAPAKHASAPTLAAARQRYEAVMRDLNSRAKGVVSAPPSAAPDDLISIDDPGGSVLEAIAILFRESHNNYIVEAGVSGTVFLKLNDVPFGKALNTLLSANSEPLTWTLQDGVYHIRPRALHVGEAGYALPRQVQLKFEWASSAGASSAAPDKSVDALTIIAEEGRKAQVSSRHLQNGAGGEETISVLPHFEPGGMVVLDITERSDSTARAGDTKSSSAETTVRVKTGETGTVRVQVSKQVSKEGGSGAERILFVTPTLIGAGGR